MPPALPLLRFPRNSHRFQAVEWFFVMVSFPGVRILSIALPAFLLVVPAFAGEGVWTSSGPPVAVSSIAIDQQNPSTVIAAGGPTVGGAQAVFTSTDSGGWIKRAEGSNGVSISSLVSAPSNPSIIYASAWVGG